MRLALQATALKQYYPEASIQLSPVSLSWRGVLRPSPDARGYEVRLVAHKDRATPFIYIIQPELEPNDDGKLPHVYDNGSLCLNRKGELRPMDLYARTTVPWASEWLFYYEIWKATNIWMGDEADADAESTRTKLHAYRVHTRAGGTYSQESSKATERG